MTKLTKEQRVILAAVFAITNIGLPMPNKQSIRSAFTCKFNFGQTPKLNTHNAVTDLGQQFMESEAVQQAFADEAYGWFKTLGSYSVERLTETWPEHGALLNTAMNLSIPLEALT